MKKASVLVIVCIVLCTLVLWGTGCGSYAQLGETEAEGRRRHLRNRRLNRAQMMADLDSIWLYDEPSRLSDKRIP